MKETIRGIRAADKYTMLRTDVICNHLNMSLEARWNYVLLEANGIKWEEVPDYIRKELLDKKVYEEETNEMD